jgi:histidyl-tRNA synthetase
MINRPRGTRDITYPKSLLYQKINLSSVKFLNSNNYQQIIFPTYEHQEIFLSSLGDSTDVVRKEMFLFNDKKNRNLALRPEGTVSVARAVCQNKLLKDNHPLKLFYWANMFRYERPQQGRYREFWQLGIELINSQGILADCEILHLAKMLLENLGINNLSFSINYLGDEETRNRYKQSLKISLENKFDLLCEDCKYRYQNNPLRIMDCDVCNSIEGIPNYSDSWNKEDSDYLEKISSSLSKMNFNFIIDQKLIRGLDYYTGLVFEVKLIDEKKTLIGGGRYDNLISKFIDKKVPAIGFALGVDRLVEFFGESLLSDKEKNNKLDLLLLSLDEKANSTSFLLKEKILRSQKDLVIEFNLEVKNKKKIFDLINFHQPRLVIIIGNKELENDFFSVKDIENKEDFIINKDLIVNWIVEKIKK